MSERRWFFRETSAFIVVLLLLVQFSTIEARGTRQADAIRALRARRQRDPLFPSELAGKCITSPVSGREICYPDLSILDYSCVKKDGNKRRTVPPPLIRHGQYKALITKFRPGESHRDNATSTAVVRSPAASPSSAKPFLVVQYQCNPGHEFLDEAEFLFCRDYHWIQTVPVCVPSNTVDAVRQKGNPCQLDNGGCSHFCHDLGGGVIRCECPPGMAIDPADYRTCKEDDPCLIANGGCSHICQSPSKAGLPPTCTCPENFILGSDKKTCFETKDWIVKPMDCPQVPFGHPTCVSECVHDDDCDGEKKCCSNGCAYVCLSPDLVERSLPDVSISPPGELEIRPGGHVNLTCTGTGFPVPSLTWYQNERRMAQREGGLGRGDPSLSASKTILIRELFSSSTFRCEAVNDFGWKSAEAKVTVLGPGSMPTTIRHRVRGTNITITWKPPVFPNGEIISYKIYYTTGDPRRPVSNWQMTEVSNVERATISDLEPLTRYYFRIQAVNDKAPGVLSLIFHIRTQEKEVHPAVTIDGFNGPYGQVQLEPLSNVNLTCRATAGFPQPSIAWYRDGVPISEPTDKAPAVDLKLSTVMETTRFECIATNKVGSANGSVDVVVAGPGTAPQQIQHRVVDGTNVDLSWGAPAITNGQITGYAVFYTSGDPEVPLEEWEVEIVERAQSVVLRSLQPNSTYNVRIQAFNQLGHGPASPAIPIEIGEPWALPNVVIESRPTAPVPPGSKLNVTCRATGVPLPSLSWKKGGETIASFHSDFELGESVTKVLVIERIFETSQFTCEATNSAGTMVSDVEVVIRGPGSAPESVQATADRQTIAVTWDEPEFPNGDVQGYYLYVIESADDTQPLTKWKRIAIDDGQAADWKLTNLKHHTRYTIRMSAYTRDNAADGEIMEGPLSERAYATTSRDGEPPSIILNPSAPRVQILPGGRVNVTCSAIGLPEPQVKWYKNGKLMGSDVNPEVPPGKVISSVDLVLEDVFETSSFECRASNPLGTAAGGVRVDVLGPGSPPRDIYPIIYSNTIDIQWQEPLVKNGEITGYEVCHTTDPHEKVEDWPTKFVAGPTADHHKLVDLHPHTNYTYMVRAFNQHGPGPWSHRHTVATASMESPPSINIYPSGEVHRVRVGDSVNLTCIAEGFPPPTVTWHMETVAQDPRFVPEAQEVTLHLDNVREPFSIDCIATNPMGEDRKTIRVEITGLGNAPTGLEGAGKGTTAHLRWNAPEVVEADIKYYLLYYTHRPEENEERWHIASVPLRLPGEPSHYFWEIQDLHPFTQYTFKVRAYTDEGPGPFSNAVQLNTTEKWFINSEVHPDASTEVPVGGGIDLLCKARGHPPPMVVWKLNERVIATPRPYVSILKLDPVTDITAVTCVAENDLDTVEKTVQLVPSDRWQTSAVPTSWSDEEDGGTVLDWTDLLVGAEEGTVYTIYYTTNPSLPLDEWSRVGTGYPLNLRLPNMTDDQAYYLRIRIMQPGREWSVITASTQIVTPKFPTNVSMVVEEETIQLVWDEVKIPNSEITGYTIYYTDDERRPLKDWHTEDITAGPVNKASIPNVRPDTPYHVKMMIQTANRERHPTATYRVRSPKFDRCAWARCEHSCTIIEDEFDTECSCRPGYQLNEDGRTCSPTTATGLPPAPGWPSPGSGDGEAADDICLEEADPGSCRDREETVWYFNSTMGRCMPFVFGGCDGNENRFVDAQHCMERCSPKPCYEKRRQSAHFPEDQRPKCDRRGDFEPLQIDGRKSEYYCVHPITGEEVEASRMGVNDTGGVPYCRSCELKRQYYSSIPPSPHGPFAPDCDHRGTYSSIQCNPITGECWCADRETGRELEGTRTVAGVKPTCDARSTTAAVAKPRNWRVYSSADKQWFYGTWQAVGNRTAKEYNVYFTSNPKDKMNKWHVISLREPKLPTKLIKHKHFPPKSNTSWVIQPVYDDGLGEPSDEYTVIADAPPQPVELRATDIKSHSVKLKWHRDRNLDPPGLAYTFYITDLATGEQHQLKSSEVFDEFVLPVEAGREYEVEMTATDEEGDESPPSNKIKFQSRPTAGDGTTDAPGSPATAGPGAISPGVTVGGEEATSGEIGEGSTVPAPGRPAATKVPGELTESPEGPDAKTVRPGEPMEITIEPDRTSPAPGIVASTGPEDKATVDGEDGLPSEKPGITPVPGEKPIPGAPTDGQSTVATDGDQTRTQMPTDGEDIEMTQAPIVGQPEEDGELGEKSTGPPVHVVTDQDGNPIGGATVGPDGDVPTGTTSGQDEGETEEPAGPGREGVPTESSEGPIDTEATDEPVPDVTRPGELPDGITPDGEESGKPDVADSDWEPPDGIAGSTAEPIATRKTEPPSATDEGVTETAEGALTGRSDATLGPEVPSYTGPPAPPLAPGAETMLPDVTDGIDQTPGHGGDSETTVSDLEPDTDATPGLPGETIGQTPEDTDGITDEPTKEGEDDEIARIGQTPSTDGDQTPGVPGGPGVTEGTEEGRPTEEGAIQVSTVEPGLGPSITEPAISVRVTETAEAPATPDGEPLDLTEEPDKEATAPIEGAEVEPTEPGAGAPGVSEEATPIPEVSEDTTPEGAESEAEPTGPGATEGPMPPLATDENGMPVEPTRGKVSHLSTDAPGRVTIDGEIAEGEDGKEPTEQPGPTGEDEDTTDVIASGGPLITEAETGIVVTVKPESAPSRVDEGDGEEPVSPSKADPKATRKPPSGTRRPDLPDETGLKTYGPPGAEAPATDTVPGVHEPPEFTPEPTGKPFDPDAVVTDRGDAIGTSPDHAPPSQPDDSRTTATSGRVRGTTPSRTAKPPVGRSTTPKTPSKTKPPASPKPTPRPTASKTTPRKPPIAGATTTASKPRAGDVTRKPPIPARTPSPSKVSPTLKPIGPVVTPKLPPQGPDQTDIEETSTDISRPGGVPSTGKKCESIDRPLDFVILLDASDSNSPEEHEQLKTTLRDMLDEYFEVDEDNVRVAFIQYSDLMAVEFALGQYADKDVMLEHVSKAPRMTGVSQTGDALAVALNLIQDGGRASDVPKVVLFLTDGNWAGDASLVAWQLQEAAVYVLAIGVGGSQVDKEELLSIVGNKEDQTIVYSNLDEVKEKLANDVLAKICSFLAFTDGGEAETFEPTDTTSAAPIFSPNLRVINVTTNSAVITWDADEPWKSSAIMYEIGLIDRAKGTIRRVNVSSLNDHYDLVLRPNKEYTVHMTAIGDKIGRSAPSKSVTFATWPTTDRPRGSTSPKSSTARPLWTTTADPRLPGEVSISDVRLGEEVTWDVEDRTKDTSAWEFIIYHVEGIFWEATLPPNTAETVISDGQIREHSITDVDFPSDNYTFWIRARNEFGDGPLSSGFIVTRPRPTTIAGTRAPGKPKSTATGKPTSTKRPGLTTPRRGRPVTTKPRATRPPISIPAAPAVPPKILEVDQTSANEVKVSWTIDNMDKLPSDWDFVIYYTTDPALPRDRWDLRYASPSDAKGFRIGKLEPDQAYTICIRARNTYGLGPFSECVEVYLMDIPSPLTPAGTGRSSPTKAKVTTTPSAKVTKPSKPGTTTKRQPVTPTKKPTAKPTPKKTPAPSRTKAPAVSVTPPGRTSKPGRTTPKAVTAKPGVTSPPGEVTMGGVTDDESGIAATAAPDGTRTPVPVGTKPPGRVTAGVSTTPVVGKEKTKVPSIRPGATSRPGVPEATGVTAGGPGQITSRPGDGRSEEPESVTKKPGVTEDDLPGVTRVPSGAEPTDLGATKKPFDAQPTGAGATTGPDGEAPAPGVTRTPPSGLEPIEPSVTKDPSETGPAEPGITEEPSNGEPSGPGFTKKPSEDTAAGPAIPGEPGAPGEPDGVTAMPGVTRAPGVPDDGTAQGPFAGAKPSPAAPEGQVTGRPGETAGPLDTSKAPKDPDAPEGIDLPSRRPLRPDTTGPTRKTPQKFVLQLDEVTANAVHLHWEREDDWDPMHEITYTFVLTTEDSETMSLGRTELRVKLPPDENEHTLSVKPGKDYSLYLISENEADGVSQTSNSVNFETPDGPETAAVGPPPVEGDQIPSGPSVSRPTITEIDQTSPTEIKVRWVSNEAPTDWHFVIYASPDPSKPDDTWQRTKATPEDAEIGKVIGGLKPDEHYHVCVQMRNETAGGPMSECVPIRLTSRAAPTKAPGVTKKPTVAAPRVRPTVVTVHMRTPESQTPRSHILDTEGPDGEDPRSTDEPEQSGVRTEKPPMGVDETESPGGTPVLGVTMDPAITDGRPKVTGGPEGTPGGTPAATVTSGLPDVTTRPGVGPDETPLEPGSNTVGPGDGGDVDTVTDDSSARMTGLPGVTDADDASRAPGVRPDGTTIPGQPEDVTRGSEVSGRPTIVSGVSPLTDEPGRTIDPKVTPDGVTGTSTRPGLSGPRTTTRRGKATTAKAATTPKSRKLPPTTKRLGLTTKRPIASTTPQRVTKPTRRPTKASTQSTLERALKKFSLALADVTPNTVSVHWERDPIWQPLDSSYTFVLTDKATGATLRTKVPSAEDEYTLSVRPGKTYGLYMISESPRAGVSQTSNAITFQTPHERKEFTKRPTVTTAKPGGTVGDPSSGVPGSLDPFIHPGHHNHSFHPTITEIDQRSPTSIAVRWVMEDLDGLPSDWYFVIHYTTDPSLPHDQWNKTEATVDDAEPGKAIDGLKPGRQYEVCVRLRNETYLGPMSECVPVRLMAHARPPIDIPPLVTRPRVTPTKPSAPVVMTTAKPGAHPTVVTVMVKTPEPHTAHPRVIGPGDLETTTIVGEQGGTPTALPAITIEIDELTPNEITIKWDHDKGLPGDTFAFTLTNLDSGNVIQAKSPSEKYPLDKYALGVSPNTSYTLSAEVTNTETDEIRSSNVLTFKTPMASSTVAPPMNATSTASPESPFDLVPTITDVEQVSDTAVRVHWTVANPKAVPQDWPYAIYYSSDPALPKEDWPKVKMSQEDSVQGTNIEGLQPEQMYDFCIRSESDATSGPCYPFQLTSLSTSTAASGGEKSPATKVAGTARPTRPPAGAVTTIPRGGVSPEATTGKTAPPGASVTERPSIAGGTTKAPTKPSATKPPTKKTPKPSITKATTTRRPSKITPTKPTKVPPTKKPAFTPKPKGTPKPTKPSAIASKPTKPIPGAKPTKAPITPRPVLATTIGGVPGDRSTKPAVPMVPGATTEFAPEATVVPARPHDLTDVPVATAIPTRPEEGASEGPITPGSGLTPSTGGPEIMPIERVTVGQEGATPPSVSDMDKPTEEPFPTQVPGGDPEGTVKPEAPGVTQLPDSWTSPTTAATTTPAYRDFTLSIPVELITMVPECNCTCLVVVEDQRRRCFFDNDTSPRPEPAIAVHRRPDGKLVVRIGDKEYVPGESKDCDDDKSKSNSDKSLTPPEGAAKDQDWVFSLTTPVPPEQDADCPCVQPLRGDQCPPGYRLWKGRCRDINECEYKNGGCAHGCVNTPGGFYCACPPGLLRDPTDPFKCVSQELMLKRMAQMMYVHMWQNGPRRGAAGVNLKPVDSFDGAVDRFKASPPPPASSNNAGGYARAVVGNGTDAFSMEWQWSEFLRKWRSKRR